MHALNRDQGADRQPWFCSGCPHNTSTKVPEGSRAMAGIGCHFMTIWMDRSTVGFTQMGGEGVPWVGQAALHQRPAHVCQPGRRHLLPQRAAGGAPEHRGGVNITYKILYNDAVAMTGGQQVGERPEGHSVVQIAQSMRAEGAQKITIVTDEPEKYEGVRPCQKASPSTTATSWTPFSVSSARSRAPRSSFTTRPVPPRSAAAASAARWQRPAPRW
jgi:indolepyruvate ferredoxin oxidoreductase